MDAATAPALTRLTDDPAADALPAWSPDGTQILFVSDRSGNEEVFVMNADGTAVEQLTDDPADDVEPAWSSAGGRMKPRRAPTPIPTKRRTDNEDIPRLAALGAGVLVIVPTGALRATTEPDPGTDRRRATHPAQHVHRWRRRRHRRHPRWPGRSSARRRRSHPHRGRQDHGAARCAIPVAHPPRPVIVNVAQGELVYIQASDCVERHYAASTVFVDPGQRQRPHRLQRQRRRDDLVRHLLRGPCRRTVDASPKASKRRPIATSRSDHTCTDSTRRHW